MKCEIYIYKKRGFIKLQLSAVGLPSNLSFGVKLDKDKQCVSLNYTAYTRLENKVNKASVVC